jgi:uncharacterized protein YndB with AHSA1/START domain
MSKIIHASVQLSCSQRQAFEMFTINERIQLWLAPLAEVDPRVGGKYDIFWDVKDKLNNSTIGCKITAIEPDDFLSFEWRGPKQFKRFMNNCDPLTHVVVFFMPRQPSRTDVHLIHTGWRETKSWEEARLWFERAWKSAFEELRKQVNENKFS